MAKGFTIIEFLIFIGIAVVLAAAAWPIYSNLQVSTQLNAASGEISQDLRLAREQSRAGVNGASHGVKFGENSYTIFQGASYAARNSEYDQVNIFSSALAISTTLPSDEIVFSTGEGIPNNAGTISVTHSVNGSRNISVNSIGVVSE